MTCNIAAILQANAETIPKSPAILTARQSVTFAELELAASRAATMLRQAGLKAGDVALIFQPMSIDLYVALLAIWRLGMVAMFVDPSAAQGHLEQCCALCPPQALIASAKAHLLRLKSPVLRQIPVKFSIGCPVPGARRWAVEKYAPDQEIISTRPETPALLTFTSGSTGQPKAALRTHGFLLAQHRVLSETLALQPGAIDLTTLPIFLLANLASGVTSLIPDADLRFPGQIDGARVMRQIQAYQPQSIAASPAFLERLVEQNCHLGFDKIFSGGAPIFPDLLERLQALAPEAEVTAVYGSTEAEPIAHIQASEIQPSDRVAMGNGKGLLTGHPVAAIHLRILPDRWGTPIQPMTRDELEAIALPVGEVGEMVVSGEHVLPGYWAEQGNAETKFQVEGQPWHRTGDAGYVDEQGRLWLLGRCSARIGDLYPFAVEAAAKLPGIRRTALAEIQGQRVLVVELMENNVEILEELKRSLHWANIQEFRVCQKIPVDPRHNAKVNYPALYKILGIDG